jgi:hypothetical protein
MPAGFFRFGAAYSADQLTVRIAAIDAVGEISSITEYSARFSVWLRGQQVSIGYGSRGCAEIDREGLMAALALSKKDETNG